MAEADPTDIQPIIAPLGVFRFVRCAGILVNHAGLPSCRSVEQTSSNAGTVLRCGETSWCCEVAFVGLLLCGFGFAAEFVSTPWQCPCELHGVGRYASDAYHLFISQGQLAQPPKDHALAWVYHWMRDHS
jgi:hypothetical protein